MTPKPPKDSLVQKIFDGGDVHAYSILAFLSVKEIAKTRLVNKAFASSRTKHLLKTKLTDYIQKILIVNHHLVVLSQRSIYTFAIDNDTPPNYSGSVLRIPNTIDNTTIKNAKTYMMLLSESNQMHARGLNLFGQFGLGDKGSDKYTSKFIAVL